MTNCRRRCQRKKEAQGNKGQHGEEEEKQEAMQVELLNKLDTSIFTVHKQSVDQTVAHFKTSLKDGLTSAEAKKRSHTRSL